MTSTMYPVITAGSHRIDGNDSKHNKVDLNKGGGPNLMNRKAVPPAKRGGFGHHGQKKSSVANARMGGGRSSSGNPASRGTVTPVGRQSFPSETRNPGHGGSVQVRDNLDTVSGRGGFGHSGQQGVPTVATNPKPGAGNTSGRMAKRITGRFNNKSKQAGGNTGQYGGPPVRLDN